MEKTESINEEDLKAIFLSPTLFAMNILNITPYRYQAEFLEEDSKRIIVVAGRQIGKTTMIAMKVIYEAFVNENWTILIVAPTLRQSKIVLDRVRELINRSNFVRAHVTKITQTEVRFDSGSVIYSLPAGKDGSFIRGFSAHMVIIDESAFVDDKIFVAVEPSISATDGTLILSGTPFGQRGFFWEIWKNSSHGRSPWRRFKIRSEDCPLITKEFLEEMKQTMSYYEYLQEYEAEFVGAEGMFFDSVKVFGSAQDYEYEIPKRKPSDKVWVLGVDISRLGTDMTAYVLVEVIEDDDGDIAEAKVLWRDTEPKSLLTGVAGRIIDLVRSHKIDYVVVDSTTLGAGVYDMLNESLNNVIPITLGLKERSEMYKNMRDLIEQGRVILNKNDTEFLYQFFSFTYEYTSTGILRIKKAEKGHDDLVDALGLALRYGKENVKVGVLEEMVEWF